MTKGLRAGIFRDSEIRGDFSNRGISSRVSRVTIVGPEIEAAGGAVFEPTGDAPAVRLVVRNIAGQRYVHAEPIAATSANGTVGAMAGGTFIYTSDSRFAEATGVRYPVSLHDRFETPEQYERLSR